MGQQSRTHPSLISCLEGFTYLCHSKRLWTIQVTSQGVTRRILNVFAESFVDPMNDLDTEKKLVDLHLFDVSSVCRKAQNILKVFYPILSCIVVAEHT